VSLDAGTRLGPYEIVGALGAGGMGEVYRARDTRLQRDVAIKVLPPAMLGNAIVQQRFEREAIAASALNHPGIVTIHDVGSYDGTRYIVMEYVAGTTLDAQISAGGMRAAEVLRIAAQAADALAAAHGAGILHRDLKPSNLIVTREGRVKVLDFGVAKLLEPATSGDTTVAAQLTEARTIVGTAAYMSPEQAEGRALDARSDIFSFGVVIYEMVTGQRPFAGQSHVALLHAITNADPIPLTHLTPSATPALEQIVLRCLRKDPGRRYQSMADLKAALEDLMAELASSRQPSQTVRRARGRPWVVAGTVLAIVGAAFIAWQRWRPAGPEEPLRAETLTTFPGHELYPSLAPDGDHVAFSWNGAKQDNTDIYVQQIGAGAPLRLTRDPRVDANPVWSPDNRWIAFLRGDATQPLSTGDRELRLIPPLGGPERKLADLRVQEITMNPAVLAWCPDSTCLVVTDTTGVGKPDALFVLALDTGEKRQLTTPDPPTLADTNPSFAPDGRSVLFIRRKTWAYGELCTLPLGAGVTAAGAVVTRAFPDLQPDSAAWLPNGEGILFSSGAISGGAALWRLPVRSGQPARLPYVGDDGVSPAVSRTRSDGRGRLVYVRSYTDENIWRVDLSAAGAPATTTGSVAIASTKADIHPQLSPDGRHVAFTSTRSGAWEIWTADPDGSNAAQLTSLHAPTGTGVPHWSPDGRLIVFASDAEGQFDIFVVSAEGGKPRNLTSHAAFDHVPRFSRDGRFIYFSSTRSGQYQIWKVPVDGGTPVQITTDGGWVSEESIDGNDLFFSSTPASVSALWRRPVSGGAPVKVLNEVVLSSFAVLDRGIYYIDQTADRARLQFHDFGTGRSQTLAGDLADRSQLAGGFAASRDGRVVMFSRRDAAIDDLMLVDGIR
jgi:Tol biopolymer transport system component